MKAENPMRFFVSVMALASLTASAGEQVPQRRPFGVTGTPVRQTINNATCQDVGDELQTHLEPGGKFFRPFIMVNGNPTLMFTFSDGYKTTYIFGGAIKHTALRPDICLVEINATAATPQEATKANQSALVELLRYMLCKVARETTGPNVEQLRSTILAHDCN
jgi:hypothetical protein